MEEKDRGLSGEIQCWAYMESGARDGEVCGAPAVEICTRRGYSVCEDHPDGGRERFRARGPELLTRCLCVCICARTVNVAFRPAGVLLCGLCAAGARAGDKCHGRKV